MAGYRIFCSTLPHSQKVKTCRQGGGRCAIIASRSDYRSSRCTPYQPRFLHAKTVLCDNWVTIGSSNFDRWNLHWNLEASQNIEDQAIAKTVENIFNNDFKNCIECTYSDWYNRNWRSRLLEWFWRKVELVALKLRNRRRP